MERTETTQQVGPWTVRAVWGDGPFPVELHITTDDQEAEQRGITSTLLRDVKLSRSGRTSQETEAARSQFSRRLRELRGLDTSGRGAVTEDYLRKLAQLYGLALKTRSTTPVKDIADALGRNPGTIKNHLTKARKLGILEEETGVIRIGLRVALDSEQYNQ
ncbi:hypothetical protein ACFY12_02465 [Streptomyces sp. NPDC001339]|uniref:hypothetical protein n=1 Tax=Streptomyces sp. NPDC001339 TaxID=3364563 RepID=UPI00369A01B1